MTDLMMGSKGEDVTTLQQALMHRGYVLPKWGADGILGHETYNAALHFAEDHDLVWEGADEYKVIPAAVVETILKEDENHRPAELVDLTDLHPVKKGRQAPRKWKSVTGIVLHQTACRLGIRPARWFDVACHVGIPSNGQILYLNTLTTFIYHAQGFNPFAVGIEIDGNFEGIDGNRLTWWSPGGGPDRVTEKQVAAARRAVEWICNEVTAHGGKITDIFAHRQSSENREADPGSRAWKEVALWAQGRLGLANEPLYTLGTGYAIPEEWDERSILDYRGRMTERGVKWIQESLNRAIGAGLDVDGIMGPRTKAAVKEFQEKSGLEADGVVGPKTRAKLEESDGPPVGVITTGW